MSDYVADELLDVTERPVHIASICFYSGIAVSLLIIVVTTVIYIVLNKREVMLFYYLIFFLGAGGSSIVSESRHPHNLFDRVPGGTFAMFPLSLEDQSPLTNVISIPSLQNTNFVNIQSSTFILRYGHTCFQSFIALALEASD